MAPDKMPVLINHEVNEIVGFTEDVGVDVNSIKIRGVISNQDAGQKLR
jgi:hypothetical protein